MINKILGIGLPKTATNSLTNALRVLGFRAIHNPNYHKIFELAKEYDVLTDAPVALTYKELDKRFPNSKFILTDRKLEDWLDSAKRHFKNTRMKRGRTMLS